MALGTLTIDIEARLARMEEGLQAAVRSNERAARAIDSQWTAAGSAIRGALAGAVAAFSVGQFAGFSRQLLDGVDKLNDLSDATGDSVENLSALEDVARRTGASMDTVGDILVRFNKVLGDAKEGSEVDRALKSLGLAARELRELDPSEALRRTAVALAGFADDGNKARLVQELFGKSVREAAPFLKDLADAGRLNATVTTEQAKQAEKFNQQLAALSKNFEDVSRSLLGKALPALNQYLLLVSKLSAGPGLGASLVEVFKGNSFTSADEALKSYNQQIADIDRKLQDIAQGRAPARSIYGADFRKELEDSRARLVQFANVYRDVLNAGSAGGGRGFVSPGAQASVPKLPALGGSMPTAKETTEAARRFEDYASGVTASLGRLAEETQTVKLARLNDQLKRLDELAAAGLDPQIVTEMRTALSGLATVEIPVEQMERMAAVQALLSQTPSGQIDQLVDLEENLADAFRTGAISAVQYEEALAVLAERFDRLSAPAEEALEQMSTFADQAQRNIQDSLGETLKRGLSGDFESIGQLWSNLLLDMVAQAAAVDLNNAIFGTNKGGGLGDLFGGIGSLFGLAKGGAFANGVQLYAAGGVFGGPTLFGHAGGLGVLGEAGPEAVLPLSRGADGKLGVRSAGGGGVQIVQHITVNGGNRNELMLGMVAAKNAAISELSEINRRGGGRA